MLRRLVDTEFNASASRQAQSQYKKMIFNGDHRGSCRASTVRMSMSYWRPSRFTTPTS